MTKRSTAAILLALAALVSTPAAAAEETLERLPQELRGVWGADCAQPEMRFEEAALYQFSDRSSSPISRIVRRDREIDLHYDRPREKLQVVDTYVVDGQTLRLTKSQYGTNVLRWNKKPWQAALPGRPAGTGEPALSGRAAEAVDRAASGEGRQGGRR
jgi:hypothetical protein